MGLDAFSRRSAHRILAAIAITAAEAAGSNAAALQSWRRAEHHLGECVRTADGLRANPRDVWNLIQVQLKLGDPARARATLSAHDPEIHSKQDAFLCAAVVETQPGTADAAFKRHAERHSDASHIKIFQGLTTEDLMATMTEFMRQDHGPLLDLVEMIRQV